MELTVARGMDPDSCPRAMQWAAEVRGGVFSAGPRRKQDFFPEEGEYLAQMIRGPPGGSPRISDLAVMRRQLRPAEAAL